MSIIDTFLYVFKADDAGLIATQKTAETATKKTTDALDKQEAATKKLGAEFGSLVGKIAGVVAAYASWQAVKVAATAAADDTNKLDAQARALHMNADALRAWQNANTRAGGSAEAMTATLQNLAQRTRDPLGALERVADRFRGLNDRQADRLGKHLGLDVGTIELMRQGREGLKQHIEQQFKFGEVTEEQIAVAKKWRIAQADMNAMGEDTRRRLMVMVIPAFTAVTEILQKVIFWTRENSRFLQLLIPVATVVGVIAFRGQILMLAKSFAALTAAMLTNPLVLFIALLVAVSAAIALVVDDLLAWREGGKSLFADLVKQYPELQKWGEFILKVYDEVANGFKELRKVLAQAGGEIVDTMSRVFEFLANKLAWVSKIIDGAKVAVRALGGALSIVGQGIADGATVNHVVQAKNQQEQGALAPTNQFGGAPPNKEESDKARQITQENVKNTTNVTKETVKETVKAAQTGVQAAQTHPMTSTTSNAISNSTTNNRSSTKNTTVQTGPVTITTAATDPEAVGKVFGTSLAAQIKQANNEFDNGISH